MRRKPKMENEMNMKAVGALAVFAVLFQLSLVGFAIWVIVKVLGHFGII